VTNRNSRDARGYGLAHKQQGEGGHLMTAIKATDFGAADTRIRQNISTQHLDESTCWPLRGGRDGR